MPEFSPTVPQLVPCKCCGETAGICGVVDFNKNCMAQKGIFPLPAAGIAVYYHRCMACGLLFTIRFDEFSHEDFANHIYNPEYQLVDPEYAQARPMKNAKSIIGLLGRTPRISIVDYGGGNGKLIEMLRPAGFFNAITYDPFVPAFSTLPEQKFQLVMAYEVMEHSPSPIETFDQLARLRADDGIIMFSTMIQPQNIEQVGLNWWYASPRNGHVTLYSAQSLQVMAQRLNLRIFSTNPGMHFMFNTIPDFARHMLRLP